MTNEDLMLAILYSFAVMCSAVLLYASLPGHALVVYLVGWLFVGISYIDNQSAAFMLLAVIADTDGWEDL